MRVSSLFPGVFSTSAYIYLRHFSFFTFTDWGGTLIVWLALGGDVRYLLVGLFVLWIL